MTKTNFAASLCLFFVLLPMAADALTVSTSAGDYDVTTVVGSFDALTSTLMAQVWWDDMDLASEFADQVRDGLGLPNSNVFSPFFAFGIRDLGAITVESQIWCEAAFCGAGAVTTSNNALDSPNITWAVATPVAAVPLPGALILFSCGLATLGLTRRKKRA